LAEISGGRKQPTMREFARGFGHGAAGPIGETAVKKRDAFLGFHVRAPKRLVLRRSGAGRFYGVKGFFFVAMDKKGWSYNAHGRVTLQEIHRVKAGFAPALARCLKFQLTR